MQEGANATFTCSFSAWSEHLVLNWYRLSPSKQNVKLASFHGGLSEPGEDPRFQVTRLPSGLDFHMSVISARRSDSGLYLCGVISLSSTVQIEETPASELRVTGEGGQSQGGQCLLSRDPQLSQGSAGPGTPRALWQHQPPVPQREAEPQGGGPGGRWPRASPPQGRPVSVDLRTHSSDPGEGSGTPEGLGDTVQVSLNPVPLALQTGS